MRDVEPYFNRLIDAPPIPEFIKNGLRDAGGLNPHGEPMLILEWGGNALRWPNGPTKWLAETEKDGERCVRIGPERWFVCRWWSPESVMIGGLAYWESKRYERVDGKTYDLLGPPPTRGQYREDVCLQNPKTGEAVPLDNRIVEFYREQRAARDAEVDLSAATDQQKEWALQRAVEQGINEQKRIRKAFMDRFKDEVKDAIEPLQRMIAQGSRPRQGMDGRWRKRKNSQVIVPSHLAPPDEETKIIIP